jgi:hypothetical protein
MKISFERYIVNKDNVTPWNIKMCNKVTIGEKVRVTNNAPHHVGQIGIVDTICIGPSAGIIVLNISPETNSTCTLIAIQSQFLEKVY